MWDILLDWIESVVVAFWAGINALIPAVPQQVQDACQGIAAAADWLRPLAFYVPWQALGVALGFVVTGAVVGVGIIVARIGASFATVGGGGT